MKVEWQISNHFTSLNPYNRTIFFNVLESLTQHFFIISYAQIVILPAYFHGYLLFITSVKQLF